MFVHNKLKISNRLLQVHAKKFKTNWICLVDKFKYKILQNKIQKNLAGILAKV